MTRLQQFLEKNHLTQRDIAAGAGVALSDVNGIVRGHQRPRVDTVNRILNFLRQYDSKVTYEKLFGEAA